MIEMSHCHPYRPSVVCPGRADSVRRGAFWWDMQIGGYVTTDIPPRKQSSAARWFGKERGIADHSGELYRLERCPFCTMALPSLFLDDEMAVYDGDGGECE